MQVVSMIASATVKQLICAASRFGDFKRLTYWCSLILTVSQFYAPQKSLLIGTTLKGKNMLPMGSIFLPLKVAPFKM